MRVGIGVRAAAGIIERNCINTTFNGVSLNMKHYKPSTIFLIAAAIFLGITFLPLFASERILDLFGREDGVFETLTAFYLFLIALIFAAAFFRFQSTSLLRKLSYAGLSFLFFLGAGEEISWGERIFHWDDHNFIRGVNVQGELTLHNLKYFQGEDSMIPVSAAQLFTVFAFTFAVLIPLACTISPRINEFVAPRFPVLPLYPGVLVVITYIFQKLMLRVLPLFPALYQHPTMPIPQGVHEIREHGYTFVLLASSIIYFAREWAAKKAADRHAVRNYVASPDSMMPVAIMESEGDKNIAHLRMDH